MARQLGLLIVLLLSCSAGALAQERDKERQRPRRDGEHKQGGKMSPELENVRKALDALTPEQRQRFQENFWRWSNMPPEEKRTLRDRDEVRRKRMAAEIEQAIQESGLTLNREQREQYVRRYAQERKKVEEQLRREMEEKRRPLVNEIVARLKTEFSSNAAPQP